LPGGKGNLQDGGLRVPFVAYWPGKIKPGQTSDHLGAFWDMMPTFAELAGIQPPSPIDGISIVPTLLDKGKQAEHKYLFFIGSKPQDNSRIIRGKSETRSDEEIMKEALTDVIVPKFA
jgi:arylsulfatase A-like enzyme